MRYLLDVNVLIALMDTSHAFHIQAHAWWQKEQPQWASCPLTQNGVVRIMASAGYRTSNPVTVPDMVTQLETFITVTDHEFWEDSLSFLNSARFDYNRILSSRHLTDIYLLALAVEHGAKLVTFDQGVPLSSVKDATSEHLVVL